MDKLENKYQNIRYSCIRFTVSFPENTELVREKASAIRGGIGEMLLRSNCISDRDCEKCGFEEECIVRRIMYSRFERTPEFMQEGNSVGYTVFCPDKRKQFFAGDQLEFTITLFGKTIVYFSQILNAVYMLGNLGLGRHGSRFMVSLVRNLYGEPVMQDGRVLMEKYKWQTLGEYISWRKRAIPDSASGGILRFGSPVTIKHGGEIVQEISPQTLADTLWRRLYILSAFENLDMERRRPEELAIPKIVGQEMRAIEVPRHSSRHNTFMRLHGSIGELELSNVSAEWLDILLAGEIVHIGKNTSFGFGKYRLDMRKP